MWGILRDDFGERYTNVFGESGAMFLGIFKPVLTQQAIQDMERLYNTKERRICDLWEEESTKLLRLPIVPYAVRLEPVKVSMRFKPRSLPYAAVFKLMKEEKREASKIRRLLKKACFPQPKTLESYTFESIIFPAKLAREKLVSMDFVQQKSNILMLGSVGTGKTHLATALGIEACRRDDHVRFFFEWPT